MLILLLFGLFSCICVAYILISMHTICVQPFLSQHFAPLPSCSTHFAIHGHDDIFRRDHASQNMHYTTILLLFVSFLLSPLSTRRMHPISPIHNHFYPCTPIFSLTCMPSPNMMFGEISPAIGEENIMFLPILASFYLVLLCACVPAPQHTHANPCAPICIHIFPSLPCLYVLHM